MISGNDVPGCDVRTRLRVHRSFAALLSLMMALAVMCAFPRASLARDELKNEDPDKYYIHLNLDSQIVTVYAKDDEGEYSRIVRRMLCTSGRTEIDPLVPEDMGTPTPAGRWKIGGRERFGKFASFNNEFARYWTQIVDGVYFHSVMFGARSLDKLKSSAFSHLGNNGSHGCVRLYVEDAKWLYYNACPGTTVEVSGKGTDNETAAAIRSPMKFKEYDAFQKNIFDNEELPNLTAWVSVDGAALRTGNGSNDKIIKKLAVDTKLEVLQAGDPWIKARLDKTEGYIKRAYVTYEEGVMQSTEEGLYLRNTVYLYEEPSTKAKRLCKVPHDVSIRALSGDEDGFTKVQYWTTVGYIETKRISTGWATLPEYGIFN